MKPRDYPPHAQLRALELLLPARVWSEEELSERARQAGREAAERHLADRLRESTVAEAFERAHAGCLALEEEPPTAEEPAPPTPPQLALEVPP